MHWFYALVPDLQLKNGLSIPSGAMLVAPIQLVQMDESSWGNDARQFNPYRFLSQAETKSEFDKSCKTTGFSLFLFQLGVMMLFHWFLLFYSFWNLYV